MRIEKLTDRGVRSLKAAGERFDVWDTTLPHGAGSFGVRVSDKGERTFQIMYRSSASGRKVRLSLGVYPQTTLEAARGRALEMSAQIVRGEDPRESAADETAGAITFGDLARYYLDRYARARGKRTLRQDVQIVENELVPAWGELPAAALQRRQIGTLLDAIQDRAMTRSKGKRTGDRRADIVGGLIAQIYSFGLDRGLVESSPAVRLGRRASGRARERWLSEVEQGVFVAAMTKEDSTMSAAWLIMLLTLGRQQEVLRMRRGDLWLGRPSLEEGWWEIPAIHAKNGRSRLVFLAPWARGLLGSLFAAPGEWIFQSSRVAGSPLRWATTATLKYRRITGIPVLGTHMLRKTGASTLASLGFPDEVVNACLGTAPLSVGKRHYNLYAYEREKEAAFAALSDHFEHLTTPHAPD